jgi:hypothetical protein
MQTTTTTTTKDSTVTITRAENGAVIEVRDLGLARQAKVRRIEDGEIDKLVAKMRELATNQNEVDIATRTGGMVANLYGYEAYTEAVVAVVFPDGRAWVRRRRIDGKKHTKTWLVRALTGIDGYQDGRRRKEKQAEAEQALIAYAAEQLREAEQLA